MPRTTSKDFDKEHSIPAKIKGDHYIYTSGSRSDEVIRYWLLSNDTIVDVPKGTKKVKMTIAEYFEMENPPALSRVKISGVRNHTVNKIAPVSKSALAELILTHNIVTPEHETLPPALRKNYKTIKQYTDEDLDRLEEYVE